MGDWRRTHWLGELRPHHVGEETVLMGWVKSRRDHGGVVFCDLRDRTGVAQVVFDPASSPESHEKVKQVRTEWVLAVKGRVRRRGEGLENPNLATGEIEVLTHEVKVLNRSDTPPFPIEDETEASDQVRLTHRHLDLRRPKMYRNLYLRHRAAHFVRSFLASEGFLDLETPFLTLSTPEGARDYLVPSRMNPGRFYALPQSPQIFKQLFMISGFERYFQVVRCFRDEDLRADRQPEFTQIDLEMSFAGEEDVMSLTERLIAGLFQEVLGAKVDLPIPRLTFDHAMDTYGTDSPDVGFGLEIRDLTDIAAKTKLKVFSQAAGSGGRVKGIAAPGSDLTRSQLDGLVGFAQDEGAKGLAWVRLGPDGWKSPIAKFFSDEEKGAIEEALNANQGDTLFFVADTRATANHVLGKVRLRLKELLGIEPEARFNFVWLHRFPLMEYDPDEKRFVALHHPFTAPLEEDEELLDDAPERVRSRAYDLVLNGTEIGGGSIRIHRREMQTRVFKALGLPDEEVRERFGFFLDALDQGAPPHGGIALGFDRLVALMVGADSIREVIPFPKTQRATCLLTGAPAEVDLEQLLELGLKLDL